MAGAVNVHPSAAVPAIVLEMLVATIRIVIDAIQKITITMVTRAAINISAAPIKIKAAVCRNRYWLFH